jgi:hypothetical protein
VRKLTRYLRYLLNTTAAVLCVLILAVWVVSYFRRDAISYVTAVTPIQPPDRYGNNYQTRFFLVDYREGRLALIYVNMHRDTSDMPAVCYNGEIPLEQGFSWLRGSLSEKVSWSHYWFHGIPGVFVMPLWALLLPPLLWTLFVIRGYRRKRRWARLGLCAKCGYDLRASTPGGRCPECGAPIPASYKPRPLSELTGPPDDYEGGR